MLFDYILEHIPNLCLETLNHLLRVLNVMCCSVCNEFLHNERFEELDCHLFRKTALVDLKFRSNDDNGTSGIVNSFTEEVLTETSLFTL